LLDTTGAAGIVFMITVVVPVALVHPFADAVTEYVPAAAVVTFEMLGFCADDVKVLGPVQL